MIPNLRPVPQPVPRPGGIWSRFYKLRCEPYTAWLTPAGCRANRTAAKDALHTLQEGLEPWELTMPGLDRLLTCGRCPRGAELQPITTEWILSLIEECLSRLEIYAGQTADPEDYRERQRAASREWNRRNPNRKR